MLNGPRPPWRGMPQRWRESAVGEALPGSVLYHSPWDSDLALVTLAKSEEGPLGMRDPEVSAKAGAASYRRMSRIPTVCKLQARPCAKGKEKRRKARVARESKRLHGQGSDHRCGKVSKEQRNSLRCAAK